MGCRNLCKRVGVNGHNGSLYDKGLKYCTTCSIYLPQQAVNNKNNSGKYCFCCGRVLRSYSRNAHNKDRQRCSNRKKLSINLLGLCQHSYHLIEHLRDIQACCCLSVFGNYPQTLVETLNMDILLPYPSFLVVFCFRFFTSKQYIPSFTFMHTTGVVDQYQARKLLM